VSGYVRGSAVEQMTPGGEEDTSQKLIDDLD
jgi:hypothetical protein